LLALAAVPTALNAIQPLVIDSTAYYVIAQHLLRAPLDPYGGTLQFWGSEGPAMATLAPPVLPYWWALAMALLGDSVVLTKLALYPFAALLTVGLDALARRFARGTECLFLSLTLLSPWILPGFDYMLDVPALALGVSGLALFVAACDRRSISLAAAAGLLAGLAMQTKYNMVTIPAAMLLYGWTTRRLALALAAGAVASACFIAWEAALWARYGQSHFLYHALGGGGRLTQSVRLRDMAYGLIGGAGTLALPLMPAASLALGRPTKQVLATLAIAAAALILIALGADRWPAAMIGARPDDVPTLATLSGVAGIAIGIVLALVVRQAFARRQDPVARFLLLWLVVEGAAYFVLSPFPAARRLIGLLLVATLIVCRDVARRIATDGASSRLLAPIAAFALLTGLDFWAIGWVDATNTRSVARAAAAQALQEAGARRAFVAGFLAGEHYAIEAGLQPIVVAGTELAEGDVLVVTPEGLQTYAAWDLSGLERIGTVTGGVNLGATLFLDYFKGRRALVTSPDTRPRTTLYRVVKATVIRPRS
jgi:hypothetical protein